MLISLKFSFGHKDFHITDFITKCQLFKLINNENLNNVHDCHGNKNTEFDKSAIQTQQQFISSINFSIIFKIKSANFSIVNFR